MEKISVNSGRGFKYNSTVLHETSKQKIEAQVVSVPDGKNGGVHHFDLVITKYIKNPTQSWEEAEVSKIRFTSDDTQSLQKLLNFLKVQKDIAQYNKASLQISDKSLSKEDREFVQNVLKYFDTPEKKALLVQAKSEDVNNLYASVKHAKNVKASKELNQLLADTSKELKLQEWIQNNTWVFGVEYINFFETSKIGIHSDSDFIVESLDGYADLIELKKSEFKLFNYDASHKNYYPTADLSQAIGQSIEYLKVMEDHRHILKDQDNILVLKPRIKIVIGRSSQMNDKEKEALRLLNDSLHNIEVMTYDEIKARADKLNQHYSQLA